MSPLTLSNAQKTLFLMINRLFKAEFIVQLKRMWRKKNEGRTWKGIISFLRFFSLFSFISFEHKRNRQNNGPMWRREKKKRFPPERLMKEFKMRRTRQSSFPEYITYLLFWTNVRVSRSLSRALGASSAMRGYELNDRKKRRTREYRGNMSTRSLSLYWLYKSLKWEKHTN